MLIIGERIKMLRESHNLSQAALAKRLGIIENGEIRYVKAEIQVRTKAMNLWASLEHILCYKKKVTPKITENLKIWAKKINLLDVKYDMVVREGRSLAQLVYEDNDDDTKCVGSMPKRRVRS